MVSTKKTSAHLVCFLVKLMLLNFASQSDEPKKSGLARACDVGAGKERIAIAGNDDRSEKVT